MRRIERYLVKRGDNLGDPEFWNPRFTDIDLRIAANEQALADVDAVADRVEGVALDRINNVITPLIEQTQERIASIPDLFTATSVSEITIGVGLRTFIVEASMRDTFAVGAYMQAARIADVEVWLAGALVSYNAATGALVLDIDQVEGAGTYSDWRLRVAGRRGKTGETGPVGLRFVPGGYNPATAYLKGDAIRYSGKVWRAKVDTTGNAPPLAGEGNAWWDLLAIDGADPVAIEHHYAETVVGGAKTNFVIPGGYKPASVMAWVNGIKLMPEDYTATDGATVVLADAAQIGDTFEFIALSAFSVADVGTTPGTVAAGDDERIVNAVQTTRKVDATGLATGGGDLSEDRTINVAKASGPEIVAGTADDIAITPKGLADADIEQRVSAWVTFKGTDTVAVIASNNVSSVTDNGVGDYTINFVAPLSDANYAPLISTNRGGGTNFGEVGYVAGVPTVNAVRVLTALLNLGTSTHNLDDPHRVHVACIGAKKA